MLCRPYWVVLCAGLCLPALLGCTGDSKGLDLSGAQGDGPGRGWDGRQFVAYQEGISPGRFPIPNMSYRVEAKHYSPKLPEYKFRHSLLIKGPEDPAVQIAIWDNPQGLELKPWFDQHLAFLVEQPSQLKERPMTRGKVKGYWIEQKRSPQALSRIDAVFASGSHVFRITCLDNDDTKARQIFDRIVDEYEPEVSP